MTSTKLIQFLHVLELYLENYPIASLACKRKKEAMYIRIYMYITIAVALYKT